MEVNLYRQEAVDHYRNRLDGEVILDQPVSSYALSAIVLCFVFVALMLLAFGTYPRKESVRGYLLPDKGLVRVDAPISGVLSELFVQEGASVKAGDILFTINVDNGDATGSGYQLELLRTHSQRVEASNEKLVVEQKLFNLRRETIERQVNNLTGELSLIDRSIVILQKKVEKSIALEEKTDSLIGQGHISDIQYQEFQQERLDREYQLLQARSTRLSIVNRIDNNMRETRELQLMWDRKLLEYKEMESTFAEKYIQISARKEYSVVSPASGVLTSLMVSVGQSIDASSTLVSLIPEESQLQAALFVPSNAVGFLEPNQQVRLRYDAFPYELYGSYQGTILHVADAALDSESARQEGHSGEFVYRLVVQLESQEINARKGKYKLHSGMEVEGDIFLEERNLIEWLFDPLFAMMGS